MTDKALNIELADSYWKYGKSHGAGFFFDKQPHDSFLGYMEQKLGVNFETYMMGFVEGLEGKDVEHYGYMAMGDSNYVGRVEIAKEVDGNSEVVGGSRSGESQAGTGTQTGTETRTQTGVDMNIGDLRESKYLKRQDVGTGVLVTVGEVSQQNVAKEGEAEDLKWVIHFKECAKPMVLNSTNGQLIAKILGSEESDDWAGKKIVLYDDPNVSFAGKLVGGIRVRAPKQQAVSTTVRGKPKLSQLPREEADPVEAGAVDGAPVDADGNELAF